MGKISQERELYALNWGIVGGLQAAGWPENTHAAPPAPKCHSPQDLHLILLAQLCAMTETDRFQLLGLWLTILGVNWSTRSVDYDYVVWGEAASSLSEEMISRAGGWEVPAAVSEVVGNQVRIRKLGILDRIPILC